MIVPAFPGSLLLPQWIAIKAIPGKTGTNHIPVVSVLMSSVSWFWNDLKEVGAFSKKCIINVCKLGLQNDNEF